MYPEVPYEVGLSHLESHPEKLDKEKSTIEYDILAAALRYFPTLVLLLNEDVIHTVPKGSKRFQKVPKLSKSKQTSKQTQFKTSDEPEKVKQIVMSSS